MIDPGFADRVGARAALAPERADVEAGGIDVTLPDGKPARLTIDLGCGSFSIEAATGALPRWFRPPYGMRNPWVVPAAAELGQRVVMWTLIPGDWRATSSEWLIPRMRPIAEHAKRILAPDGEKPPAGTGDILCLHDGSHRQLNADRLPTLAALEHWLPRWRDLGLEFVTIEDAVSAPRIHEQGQPPTVFIEKRLPAAATAALIKMGYPTKVIPELGAVNTITIRPGQLDGAFDPRKGGAAVGN